MIRGGITILHHCEFLAIYDQVLHFALKPFLKTIPSYVKDSFDFLRKCQRDTTPDNVIATFNVVSLYTSIPHDLGIEALNFFITKFPSILHPRFPKAFVLESAEFILKNNTLYFDALNFLQIQGTAMGTIFAPTYATLSMAYLENKVYTILTESKVSDFIEDYKLCNLSRKVEQGKRRI